MDATLLPDEDQAHAADHAPTRRARPGRWRALWAGTRAAVGGLLGLAPHVMHHLGFLAGAALLTGVLGNTVLYAAGMLLSLPMLNRLRKRFGTWKAPAVGAAAFTALFALTAGAAAFTALFALSAFVIGPALNPTPTTPAPSSTAPAAPAPAGSVVPDAAHDAHHR